MKDLSWKRLEEEGIKGREETTWLGGRKAMCSIANRGKWVRFPSQPGIQEDEGGEKEEVENAKKKTWRSREKRG